MPRVVHGIDKKSIKKLKKNHEYVLSRVRVLDLDEMFFNLIKIFLCGEINAEIKVYPVFG